MSSTPELRARPGERILLVDDEQSVRSALSQILSSSGYEVVPAANGEEALSFADEKPFDAILCDLQMPEMDGLQLLRVLKERSIQSCIIVMSAYGTAKTALEAIKLGAYDYVAKPFDGDEILLTLKKALEKGRLQAENEVLRREVTRRYSFGNIIAESSGMLDIFETIKKVADYKTTVMLCGESGTGKELIAKAIHYNSSRKNKRFVAINCGAIPENLLESELFGHKRGSFTDATKDKKGLFEEADGGTILLDEIGEMPLHLQVKLLRVLQEGEIRPVGESKLVPIDIRVIAATLRDLEEDVDDGRFRDDLFYRINVVSIKVPALKERKEDIPLLVNHFIRKNQDRLGLKIFGVEKAAMEALLEHSWPGNVRELENCIERSMILTDKEQITYESLPKAVKSKNTDGAQLLNLADDNLSIKAHSRAVEETLIRKALEQTKGNRTHAAKLLEISHRTLLYKLKEYAIEDR